MSSGFGRGDVWVHDARLRPSLTLETELIFPSADEDGDTHRNIRVTVDEPSPDVIQEAMGRFWTLVDPGTEEEEES